MSELQLPELNTGKPVISMAPLVDVVFLLLIFFMVTTVFPDQGLLIEKPRSENTAKLPGKHLEIKLDRNDHIFFRNTRVDITDVRRLLKEERMLRPELSVMLKADKAATTGALIALIDAAKASGAQLLGLATDDITSER